MPSPDEEIAAWSGAGAGSGSDAWAASDAAFDSHDAVRGFDRDENMGGPARRDSAEAGSLSREASGSAREGGYDDTLKVACERIAGRYLLSQRQTEVLYLLARGHTAGYVQDKLCISLSTAKSHIYNIYKKLDIHKQHELLAMVEEEMESLR